MIRSLKIVSLGFKYLLLSANQFSVARISIRYSGLLILLFMNWLGVYQW